MNDAGYTRPPERTVSVPVCGIDLDIPETLHDHLEILAKGAGKTVSEYATRTFEIAEDRPLGWERFPLEAAMLLTLYRFAFDERDSTIRCLVHIWQR